VEQVKWLGDLWRELCRTGKGECSVSTASATGEGESGTAVPPSRDAVDEPVRFASGTVTYSVSAAQFDTDQTTLKASADALLLTIAVQIRNDYSTVNVFGYADRRGSPERNKELSVLRAQAVADVLRKHSVRGIVVRGMGVTERCPYDIEVPATASDDERLQCFRRVDIVAS
jgi:outer membrane protein OmpA-like peptidoglycan-associated protein